MFRANAGRLLAAGLLPLFLLSVPLGVGIAAQESNAQKASGKTGKKKRRAYRGRLPNGWSKLNLSEEQKKKIYAHQVAARPKIVELQEQLRKLRMELDGKVRSVLTDEQRKGVERIDATAKQKALQRKSKRSTRKKASVDKASLDE